MECYRIENLSFTYPERELSALDGISLTVNRGEFITLCGKSGCGKTTFLRLLKPLLAPHGKQSGNIYYMGRPAEEMDPEEQASEIGFVMQNPDNQIVTDKVWHELAFGLESLGCSNGEIRARVSEMASFFGIQTWFHKKVTELSGGQKQILNLASVMVMQPSVLILDEPTAQLDPVAAVEFIKILEKINRELGTAVIISEHRPEETFSMSDRVIVMDQGRITAEGPPRKVCEILMKSGHEMCSALPAPAIVYGSVEKGDAYPVTVREGREWLEKYSDNHKLNPEVIPLPDNGNTDRETVIEIKNAWFRYERNRPDVIKGLSACIGRGEIFAVMGGNGAGKTTALSLISGLNRPYRGEIRIKGRKISEIKDMYNGTLGLLPQDPRTLFTKKTVYQDLSEILSDKKLNREEADKRVKKISVLCRIDNLLYCHPYDLSGGEQQRTALAKVLLKEPEILLLDEPTKGLDAEFKTVFADILKDLKSRGVTVVMVSHDIEFCAENADRCAMFFDGSITSEDVPRRFFAGKSFYTTAASRMARAVLPEAVLTDDIICACGGSAGKRNTGISPESGPLPIKSEEISQKDRKKPGTGRAILGCLFGVLFAVTCIIQMRAGRTSGTFGLQIITIFELAVCLICFLPHKDTGAEMIRRPETEKNLTKRTAAAALMILIAVPVTIYIGFSFLDDRKYYFISLMIILETLIPFFLIFEKRKPQARELIVISVLCAIAVAGRAAFFMLPQFKPVAAIVITAGICLGGESGFMVGSVTGFVSNFFFGQGPWTPWQMFAFGIIGFLAGILFRKGILRKSRISLCIFGFAAVLVIYGGIMNPASVIMWQDRPSSEMFVTAYIMGLPFDLVHAASTAFFLWFLSEPMIEKIERIKIKYGLMEP